MAKTAKQPKTLLYAAHRKQSGCIPVVHVASVLLLLASHWPSEWTAERWKVQGLGHCFPEPSAYWFKHMFQMREMKSYSQIMKRTIFLRHISHCSVCQRNFPWPLESPPFIGSHAHFFWDVRQSGWRLTYKYPVARPTKLLCYQEEVKAHFRKQSVSGMK